MIGICATDGSGLWTDVCKPVKILRLDIAYLDNETLIGSTFGELRVYFDVKSWDAVYDGFIYTDKNWIKDFRSFLRSMNFTDRAVESIDYSELGMQGTDYVSMDIADPFIIECDKLTNFVYGNESKKIEVTMSALDNQ